MSLNYIVKEGIAGIKRTKLAATTSIFSLFIALLLLGVLSRVSYNVYTKAMSLKVVEIEVFLFDVDDRSIQEINNQISKNELVDNVSFISKDSASAIMRRELGEGAADLVALNFLPASFKVTVNTESGADAVEALASSFRNIRGVDEVAYNQALLRALEANLNIFSLVGIGVGLLILLAALALVYNTIRLTIYAKKDLIRAMKLVGATNGFIRSPFIIEGIIQGLIGSSLAVLSVFFVFEFLVPVYIPQVGTIAWPFGRWYFLTGAMILLGVLMGWWGSRIASRKFIAETYISG